MYTYLLLLIVIVYLVFTLFYTNGDVSFPGSLILFAYAISMFFLVSEIRLWDAYISSKTFGIFVCGLTSYLLSSLLSSKFLSR
ncbi:MAG: hypothetical protein IJ192_07570, partial [Clostridia bacterium]|nr:hypothetical protein [Clostridia bacterium]